MKKSDMINSLAQGTKVGAKVANVYFTLISAIIAIPGYFIEFHNYNQFYKWLLSSLPSLTIIVLTIFVVGCFCIKFFTGKRINRLQIIEFVITVPIGTLVAIGALVYVVNKNSWGWWLLFATAVVFKLLNKVFDHLPINKTVVTNYPTRKAEIGHV